MRRALHLGGLDVLSKPTSLAHSAFYSYFGQQKKPAHMDGQGEAIADIAVASPCSETASVPRLPTG